MKYRFNNINDISKKRYHKNIKNKIYLKYLITFIFLLIILFIIWIFIGEVDVVVKTDGVIRYSNNTSTVYNIKGGILKKIIDTNKNDINKGDLLFSLVNKNLIERKNYLVKTNKKNDKKINDLKIIYDYLNEKNIEKNIHNDIYRHQLFIIKKKIEQIKEKIYCKKERLEKLKPLKGISITEARINKEKREYEDLKYKLKFYKKEKLVKIKKEINKYKDTIEKNKMDIKNINKNIKYNTIYSPINGNIQFIRKYNVGDYIPSGIKVMKIIPKDKEKYIVDLIIKNKDILKISKDDLVKFKIASYPYKEYGIAKGNIISIDTEITNIDDKNYVYKIESTINNYLIKGNNKKIVHYKNGMLTEASIVVGRRKIIYYLLEKLDFLN